VLLPPDVKAFVLNKSPFANKIAQDHWQIRTHRRLYRLIHTDTMQVELFLKWLKDNLEPGMSMRITTHNILMQWTSDQTSVHKPKNKIDFKE
jgi:small subunit ribosomal protein S10